MSFMSTSHLTISVVKMNNIIDKPRKMITHEQKHVHQIKYVIRNELVPFCIGFIGLSLV
jgi:hypothetical protein